METTPLRSKILDTIIRKSTLKQRVFDNTFAAFNELKDKLSMLPGLAFHDALSVGLIGGEKPFVYYLLAVCV